MGKVEKTRFERNWTTFVNPAFWAACESPAKMLVRNPPRGIRSQECFLVSPRWGKSKKRVLNAIGRPSYTRLFTLLGKAQPKWWYETHLVGFDPKGVFSFRPDGESRKKRVLNTIGRPSSTRLFALLGKAQPKWWHETHLVGFDPKGVFSFRPDLESRKNAFWTQLDDLCVPDFLRCLKMPSQNGGMKPTSWYSIPSVFFRFAPMGKVEKTRFERNWTTFVCAAWKSPAKMVVWNPPRRIRSQGCFFVSPRWGKSKKTRFERNWTTFVNRLFTLLGKAQPKWWYETHLVGFDPKGFFSFRPDGESRKNAFWTQLDDLRQPAFYAAWKSPAKMVVWNPPPRIRSHGCFSVSPRWGKSKKRVLNAIGRPSSTRLFALLGKSPDKIVVWNPPCGIRSQGCFFVSPRWGKSKKRVLNAIGRPSSTRLFASA